MAWKKGNPGCPCCVCKGGGTICVSPLSTCPNYPPISGAVVTLKQGSTVVGTCTTSLMIRSLTLSIPGSGYTDGKDFELGITGGGGADASARFDVVGGVPTNLRLTDGGHDFDGSAIAFDLSASAGGTGTTITYSLVVQCCFRGLPNGSYKVTVEADNYPLYTSPTLKIRPCKVDVGPLMTPNKIPVWMWVGGCGRVELNTLIPQLAGVTVNAVQGGVTVATGVTDSTGHVELWVLPLPTTYTAVGTGRYASNSVTATITGYCRNNINNPFADRQILLPAALGFHCAPRCRDPIPWTLNLSTPADGGFALTFDPTYGYWWATNGTIFYAYNGDLWRGTGTTPLISSACVLPGGPSGAGSPNGYVYSESCSPFMASWEGLPNRSYRGQSGSGGFCLFSGFVSPGGGTITISE